MFAHVAQRLFRPNGIRSEIVLVFGPGLSLVVFACCWQVWKIRKQDIARAPWKNIVGTHSFTLSVSRSLLFQRPWAAIYSEFSNCLMPNDVFLDGPPMTQYQDVLRIFGFDDQRRRAQNLPAEICSNELHQALSSGEGNLFLLFSTVSLLFQPCWNAAGKRFPGSWDADDVSCQMCCFTSGLQ